MSALVWESLSWLSKKLLTNIKVWPTVFLLETTQLVSETHLATESHKTEQIRSQVGLCRNGVNYHLLVT